MVGGMMTKTDAIPTPVWFYYFNVDDVGAAVSRTKAAGGEILMGPHQVPGGSWIAQCRDPQGALFAIVGAQR
jgi:predicted enzyme related to lactoylglutathione lyase